MPSPDEAATDDYFNDISQPLPTKDQSNQSQPKSKRVACVLCRKRKLRCDGIRPSCSTCTRLSHTCAYDEVRKKSGPKRGYVKELEARLAQVETMLRTNDSMEMPPNAVNLDGEMPEFGSIDPNQEELMREMRVGSMSFSDEAMGRGMRGPKHLNSDRDDLPVNPWQDPTTTDPDAMADVEGGPLPPASASAAYTGPGTQGFLPEVKNWGPSLMATGMDEPLPPPEVCAELTQAYFERVNLAAPLLHRPRFMMAMNHTIPSMRPPLSLQYAIWTLAASAYPKYGDMQEYLYRRARHYLERDEMMGVGERMLGLPTAQAWQCVSAYEFKVMYFPRAWLSTGRCSRLCAMMGLHKVDGQILDAKQCLPPPKDWIEKEERRRLFWLSFAGDRYASIGTGWPMSVDEADIQTNLPSSEEAYENGIPEATPSLEEALAPGGAENISSMASVALIACIFGRNLLHLHRQSPESKDSDINGDFWKRHRKLDGIILNLLLCLPDSLRMSNCSRDPKVVFMNMCIHTAVICLHQAAIFKVERNNLPGKLSMESKMRCLTAAAEISSLMKMTSHLDMSQANPFMAFSLYVAARVFIQYLKSRPKDDTAKASLHFLLSALHAMKKYNPLAESFIAQLDVDLEVAGFEDLRSLKVRAARKAQQESGEWACNQDREDGEQKRRTTFGDGGLAQHSNPRKASGGLTGNFPPEVLAVMAQHNGNFKGIMPTRINMTSSAPTTNPSPQTQSSSDSDIMDRAFGWANNENTPTTSMSNHNASPTDLSSENTSPPVSSTLSYRHTQTTTFYQPQQQHQQHQQQYQQQQQQDLSQPDQQVPVAALLPEFASFAPQDFAQFDKGSSSTILELGAVDETQLFQLSEAEWGQVMGEFGDGFDMVGGNGEMQWQQGGLRDPFDL